jgi:hypothetical protein
MGVESGRGLTPTHRFHAPLDGKQKYIRSPVPLCWGVGVLFYPRLGMDPVTFRSSTICITVHSGEFEYE